MATDLARIAIATHNDIVMARKTGRDMAAAYGFPAIDCAQIATVISELARNIFLYAGTGRIEIRLRADFAPRRGIEIVATDEGPGIPDLELAMRDGYSTSQGLGLGLPGSRRLMDDFEIHSEVGIGTVVRACKWLRR